MNGFDSTIKIREIEKEKNIQKKIPIIAVSAGADGANKEKCIEVGMNDFVSKVLFLIFY